MAGFVKLDRSWFERDAPIVAPELLNKLLVVTVDGIRCTGRISETEAYTSDDPASHTFGGRTERNAVMFGPPGHLYVYLSYGIHQCANVVTGPVDSGQAVLLRAVEPVDGVEVMRLRRARPEREGDRHIGDGPGKLCQALGIVAEHNGVDVLSSHVRIMDDGVAPPDVPICGPRVGITKATTTPWRFRLPSSD